MSWIQKLCEVYDVMSGSDECELLPIGFTQKKIKYNIIISADGEFVTAQELPKNEQLSTVPTTSEAEARSGKNPVPFPLAEQLKYLVAEGTDQDESPRFSDYLQRLEKWCGDPSAPECLRTLYRYLEKRTLLSDMMSVPNLKLQYHKNEELRDAAGTDSSSIACFSVQCVDGDSRLWMRRDVRESWSGYSAAFQTENSQLCYATGKLLSAPEKHPKLLGNAKLISGEDAGFPFQYKGRFSADRSASAVSSYVSVRAHNALRWLLDHQGFMRYGMSLVAWNTAVPVLEEEDIFGTGEKKSTPDTFEAYANALRNATAGYMEDLRRYSDANSLTEDAKRRMNEIVIMGLQAATDGRMSITYYQELPGNLYVDRLKKWSDGCLWEMPGKQNALCSPTWREICEAVIGKDNVRTAMADAQCKKSATKLMRETQTRLLNCVTNKSPLPKDFVCQAFERAIRPPAFTDSEGRWNRFAWTSCVATTCALIRKKNIQENAAVYSPVLDTNCTNRDYLFGRLFAAAHKIELDSTEDFKNPTAALRMMMRFVQSPQNAWLNLFCKLIPYLRRLGQGKPPYSGNLADSYLCLLGEIEQKLTPEGHSSKRPLSFEFLVGFSAQLRELYLKAEERQKSEEAKPYFLPVGRDCLFGCLLAVADICEWNSESEKEGERRSSKRDGRTNALSLVSQFVSNPSLTWEHIHDKLIPYFEKSDASSSRYLQKLISEIEQRFDIAERKSNAPLGSSFLNAYLSMRLALRVKGGLGHEEKRPYERKFFVPADRNEAYGALLALENQTERFVLDSEKEPEENRLSNALRFLPRAAKRPNEVTGYLLARMLPYQKKLFFPDLIIEKKEQLLNIISANGWNTDEPLGPDYLHTFYTYNIFSRKENE